MDKVTILYKMLELQIPFCFLKLNDGECNAMEDTNSVISRGDQSSSVLLSEKLIESLNYEAPNYFVGLPCQVCCNHCREIAIKNINNKERQKNIDTDCYFLNANILINSNVNDTIRALTNYLINRHLIIITNKQIITIIFLFIYYLYINRLKKN